MRQIMKLRVVVFTAIFLFSAPTVFAAGVFFEVKNTDIRVEDSFESGFFLNTNNDDINAIEGRVVFPGNLLELKEIREGNSIVNLWIEQPKNKNGEILFSGIVPGGYFGDKGLIFSMVFQSIQEGRALIEARDMKVLLNDGKGTETDTTNSNLQLVVFERGTSVLPPVTVEINDMDLPEVFEPIVTSDPAMFGGKYFLVFVTQDKGSGIDHYEVREGKGSFITVKSPYLLQNQNLNEEIAVKAVDKNGNKRTVILPPPKPRPWYENYMILAIITVIGLIIVGVILRKILWRKSIKSR